jgi:hypothetical protein
MVSRSGDECGIDCRFESGTSYRERRVSSRPASGLRDRPPTTAPHIDPAPGRSSRASNLISRADIRNIRLIMPGRFPAPASAWRDVPGYRPKFPTECPSDSNAGSGNRSPPEISVPIIHLHGYAGRRRAITSRQVSGTERRDRENPRGIEWRGSPHASPCCYFETLATRPSIFVSAPKLFVDTVVCQYIFVYPSGNVPRISANFRHSFFITVSLRGPGNGPSSCRRHELPFCRRAILVGTMW